MPYDEDYDSRAKRHKRTLIRSLIAAGLAVLVLGGLFVGIATVNSLNKADGGEVIVVRNGGLFDDNQFRQIVTTADGLTGTGWWSQIHRYPTTQRFFKVGPGGDSNGDIPLPTGQGHKHVPRLYFAGVDLQTRLA